MFEVVVIGLGHLGTISARKVGALDDVAIVGGADPNEAARDQFETAVDVPTYADRDVLLAETDADAALINTPHTLHAADARACLEAGLHTHLEKPFVETIAEGIELVELADERDLTLAVGYQRRLSPRFEELRRIVESGRIGELHAATGYLEQQWVGVASDTWRMDPGLSGGGQLSDSGSHLLDALCYVTGADPTSVVATIDDRGHEVDVNASLSATLETDSERVTASLLVTGEGTTTPKTGDFLQLWGTEGSVAVNRGEISVVEGQTEYTTTKEDPGFVEFTGMKLEHFVDAVRGGTTLRTSARNALRTVALTEAAYESASTGQRVSIPDLP